MKHFTTEEWIDFVNHVDSGERRKAIEKHLGSGCQRCKKTLALWQKVQNTASGEAKYQPPAGAVRVVKAAFSQASLAGKRKKTRSLVEVLFDSFLQPGLAGVRSARTGTRQMLYRAEPYQIDVHIESKLRGERLVVTGQLLDVTHPEIAGSDVHVTLSNRRGNLVHTMTNQHGEFSGEVENSGELELSFPGRDEKPVVISLRNALGNQTGGRA